MPRPVNIDWSMTLTVWTQRTVLFLIQPKRKIQIFCHLFFNDFSTAAQLNDSLQACKFCSEICAKICFFDQCQHLFHTRSWNTYLNFKNIFYLFLKTQTYFLSWQSEHVHMKYQIHLCCWCLEQNVQKKFFKIFKRCKLIVVRCDMIVKYNYWH